MHACLPATAMLPTTAARTVLTPTPAVAPALTHPLLCARTGTNTLGPCTPAPAAEAAPHCSHLCYPTPPPEVATHCANLHVLALVPGTHTTPRPLGGRISGEGGDGDLLGGRGHMMGGDIG